MIFACGCYISILAVNCCTSALYKSMLLGFLLIGAPGKRGEPGPRGTKGVKGDSGGTVYTRWGRTDCPKSVKTQTLYSGTYVFFCKIESNC